MKTLKVLPLAIIGTVLGLIIAGFLIVTRTLPVQASHQATAIDNLYIYTLVFSGIIFAIVLLFLLVAIYRYRANPGDHRDGANIHGITWLEILWTAIPFVIVLTCAFAGWLVLNRDNVKGAALERGEVIHISAYQFGWKYSYQGHGVRDNPQLVVPIDTPILFDITTMDVMHSFWVPAWRMQMGATPAQVNQITVTPTKLGEFDIVCAFLCGDGHTQMNSAVEGGLVTKVRVVDRADFDAWLAEQKAAKQGANA